MRKIATVTGLPPVLAMTKAGDSPGVRHASCTAGCTDPTLQYFGPSAAAQAGLFPNPVNGYLEMNFTPRKGYVVVTHGKAPSSPVHAGSGTPGNSIGAHPVPWLHPKFQVRYWSVANYLAAKPFPIVKIGRGANAIFGGTADYVTTLKNGTTPWSPRCPRTSRPRRH